MKKLGFLVLAVSASIVMNSLFAAEDAKIDLKGINCPVAGTKAAKEDKSVAYKGGKVFFCCGNCPKAFEKDTAKFATKANQQLVATKQAKQLKCPLSGGDLNDATEIEVAGTKVKFCCNKCQGKVESAKGDEQLNLVFSDKAFEKAFKVGVDEKK